MIDQESPKHIPLFRNKFSLIMRYTSLYSEKKSLFSEKFYTFRSWSGLLRENINMKNIFYANRVPTFFEVPSRLDLALYFLCTYQLHFLAEGDETELQFAESVLTPAANNYYQKNNINFNTPPEDFIYAFEDDHYIQFLIGLDSDTSDILREFVGLDDLVPLLVALDIPNNRFAVMDYGTEISIESVNEFLDKFQKGNLEFRIINIRNNSNDVENNTN